MEYPVVLDGHPVGSCTIEDLGLYWRVSCHCQYVSDQVERLYSGKKALGVLIPEEVGLGLHRRLSKKATPELPPQNGVFSLRALTEAEPWEGNVLGYDLHGILVEDYLLFPYQSDRPCPCEPLFCFFFIEDGFWKLNLKNIRPVQS